MNENLRNHITKRLGKKVENLEFVLSHFERIHVNKNQLLLKEGDLCRHVYYIESGSLQVYVNNDGEETTRDIVIEDNWCSELMSFGQQQPSRENIRAIEASELMRIDRPAFHMLTQQVPQFDAVYKQILEQSYANSVYRINTFVSLSALERIRWVMDYRPGLMNRFSSKLIASYLGINKDVFSRLKSQL